MRFQRWRTRLWTLVYLCAMFVVCATGQAGAQELRAAFYAAGFTQPVAFVQDPTDPQAQFVVEQGGRIRTVRAGSVQDTDFLNLEGIVSSDNERGLLGMAFAPDYATSGRFFVNFLDAANNTVI